MIRAAKVRICNDLRYQQVQNRVFIKHTRLWNSLREEEVQGKRMCIQLKVKTLQYG